MPDGVATWSATFAVMELLLDAIRADLGDLKTGVGGDFDNVGALLVSLRTDIEAIKNEIGLLDIPPDAMPDVGTLKTDVAALKTSVATLQSNVSILQTNVTTLQTNVTSLQTRATSLESRATGLETRATNLETDVTALKTDAIAFVFSGTPVIGHTINVPLTYNLSIPANLTGSSYRCGTNPLADSVFTLTRMTATGITSTIGTINLSTAGAWSAAGSPGSNALVAGDTLRLTATAVGGNLTNVGITIRATRR